MDILKILGDPTYHYIMDHYRELFFWSILCQFVPGIVTGLVILGIVRKVLKALLKLTSKKAPGQYMLVFICESLIEYEWQKIVGKKKQ